MANSNLTSPVQAILRKVDLLQGRINKLRPYSPELTATLHEKIKVEWTYHSNALEGSALTLGDTMFFLREGLRSEGKPPEAYLEAKNHADAIDGLYSIIDDGQDLSENLIKRLHGVLVRGTKLAHPKNAAGQTIQNSFHAGAYKKEPNHVVALSGKIHHFSHPSNVTDEMERLLKWYRQENSLHVLEKAAIFHYRFAGIHPFDDGNGRMARLLMNLILMRNGYLPCIIQYTHRIKYLEVLAEVDAARDYDSFIVWMGEELMFNQEQLLHVLTTKAPPFILKKG